MYLRCYTADEIGEEVGLELKTAQREIEALLDNNADIRKSPKVQFSDVDQKTGEPAFSPPLYGEEVGLEKRQAYDEIEALSQISTDAKKFAKVQFLDSDFSPPLYNVWAFGKKSNETSHGLPVPSTVSTLFKFGNSAIFEQVSTPEGFFSRSDASSLLLRDFRFESDFRLERFFWASRNRR